jgi:microcin C transport system substrate-binding protein
MFERPENLPRYQIDASGSGERVIWWHDAAKASKLEQSKP